MSDEVIEGLDDCLDFIDQLPQRLAKGAVQRVLRRGGEILRQLWHDNARVRKRGEGHGPAGRFRVSIDVSSRLERSLQKQVQASDSAPAAVAYVGPNRQGYPEAVFEEFGAMAHNEAANAPGRRAWEAGKDQALEAIAAELGPELERTVARYAKKQARG